MTTASTISAARPLDAKRLLAVGQAADQRAETDDARRDDHHGGIDRVTGQRLHAGAARDEQRQQQGHLNHGDGQGEDECAKRLADAVGDHLGMVHGGEHGRDERRTAAREHPGLLTDGGHEKENRRGCDWGECRPVVQEVCHDFAAGQGRSGGMRAIVWGGIDEGGQRRLDGLHGRS
ncbi:MAG: hypothetical protein LW698_01880 [Planctomycetaceae bacterium]|nr:hypothetical protein [Planctomycetaceae bacterium]